MSSHMVEAIVIGALAILVALGVIHDRISGDPARRRTLEEPALLRLSLLAAIAQDERKHARALRKAARRRNQGPPPAAGSHEVGYGPEVQFQPGQFQPGQFRPGP